MAHILDREREAVAEIGATRVRRGAAWALVAAFGAVLAVGVALEGRRIVAGTSRVVPGEPPIPGPARLFAVARESGLRAANRKLREALAALEVSAGRHSALSESLRPAAQWALLHHLRYGNSQVVAARDGFLYFETALDHLVGPAFLSPPFLERRRRAAEPDGRFDPDPLPALADFAAQLGERGIRLLFLPVPVKAQIHPEPLFAPGVAPPASLANPSRADLLVRLEEAGIATYDPAPDLRAAALRGELVFMPRDTHWSPLGMRIAARGLARALVERGLVPERPPAGLERHPEPREHVSDLVSLLGLGTHARRIAPDRLELDRVTAMGGVPLEGSPGASDVLLLGDSYAAIFSDDGAGFGEQLAFELDRPVRKIARTAANQFAGRVRWLRENPATLEGVSVVIYEVTERGLSTNSWAPTPLEKPPVRRRNGP